VVPPSLRDLGTKTKSSRMGKCSDVDESSFDSEMALLYQVAVFLPKDILSAVVVDTTLVNNTQVTRSTRMVQRSIVDYSCRCSNANLASARLTT
jgi:hypothetical protein